MEFKEDHYPCLSISKYFNRIEEALQLSYNAKFP